METFAGQLSDKFSPELAESLLKIGVKRLIGVNENLFYEGDEATFLPIVITGKIKMVRCPEAGKEIILGVFRSGDIFAIPPAMDGKRFPATAVALEQSHLLLLPRRDFLALMKTSAEFSTLVMGRMCGILRDQGDTVRILAITSAEHRVASVLLRLAGELGDIEIKKITHRRQDIAEMAGLSLETTIRTVRKLADRGFLKIVRGRIFIETTEHLRNFLR